ncbi:unnamed protein product, partial [Polarella glacialis]
APKDVRHRLLQADFDLRAVLDERASQLLDKDESGLLEVLDLQVQLRRASGQIEVLQQRLGQRDAWLEDIRQAAAEVDQRQR